MKSTHRFFLVSACVLAALVLVLSPVYKRAPVTYSATKVAPSRLPIFRLANPKTTTEDASRKAQGILGIKGPVKRLGSRLSIQSGPKIVDFNTKSGAIWASDRSQMWNPYLKPSLPDKDRARSIAEDYLKRNGLLPREEKYSTTSFTSVGGTQAAYFDPASKKRSDRKLDLTVNYATTINIPGGDQHLPIVGGGGEVNVTIGDGGKVIGAQSLWRAIDGVEMDSPVVSQEKADAQFKKLTAELKLRSVKSYLAYYSAPASVAQQYLYPVYVYRASAEISNDVVPLRQIMIPATEFGPKPPSVRPVKARPADAKPTRRSTMPEGYEERGIKTRDNAHAMLQTSWKEAGSSYIGTSGGLSGSQGNVQGFVDGMSADGWNINFVWGDGNAFESDWRANDDDWVDAADFVFYTGHASMNSWVLRNPDDGSLHFSEVGNAPQNPGDMWGQQDLEWVIVAACGPLQDDVISPGGGDVFARWDGAFDGLHQLLGYGAITEDNSEEGSSVAEYTRDGEKVIDAWFRAAREIQPGNNGEAAPDGPTVWVGVMYVGKSGADPFNDHIWGHGSVSPDPRSPTFYVAMWTTC